MPGLVGFTKSRRTASSTQLLADMLSTITHQPFYNRSALFDSDQVCSASSLLINHSSKQPVKQYGLSLWMDGEIYGSSDSSVTLTSGISGWLTYIADMYELTGSYSFLNRVDGIFSIAVYDSVRQKIHLITDSIGFKQLFYSIIDANLVWASESKALLAYPGFKAEIDTGSLQDFVQNGHLTGNKSWFKDASLVPPGSVVTYDLTSKVIRIDKYSDWESIKPDHGLKKEEAVHQVGYLFKRAVSRRILPEERLAVSLSGGLDSRAILAAASQGNNDLKTFTFGQKGIDDQSIACRIAREKNLDHKFYEIHNSNWFEPRIRGIWWTEGQKSLLHMHGIEFLQSIKDLGDVEFNGFLGDAVLGEAYLRSKTGLNDAILNRGRRFIYMGLKLSEVFHAVRTPFVDAELFRFSRRLPGGLLKNHNLYASMLLEQFPEYFENLPWSSTKASLSRSSRVNGLYLIREKVKRRLLSMAGKAGYSVKNTNGLGDYPNWLRSDKIRTFTAPLLFDNGAIYPEFLSQDKVKKCFEAHMKGFNKDEELCRYITLEIWFQQVYNKRFR